MQKHPTLNVFSFISFSFIFFISEMLQQIQAILYLRLCN